MAEAASDSANRTWFKAAFASDDSWQAMVDACLAQLGEARTGANLGFLYGTSELAEQIPAILARLRDATAIEDWVGTVGMGVAGVGVEVHNRPALAMLIAALPEDGYRIFEPVTDSLAPFTAEHGEWLTQHQPFFGIVHGDPRHPQIDKVLSALSDETSSFLVGGLTASSGLLPQIAGQAVDGGLSGVLIAPELPVVTGLTQGCSPVGPIHRITDAENNVLKSLDDRPALEVFKEDIGEVLARDLRRVGGYIHAGFPIRGSDTGDYLVRNLTSIDLNEQTVSVGQLVETGESVLFCRRDGNSAREDLQRMVENVKSRAGTAPKAALYFSCVARGPHMFGGESEELKLLQDTLGEVPLVGFFGNGEISNDRLYGYTGVLALFV